MNRQTLMLNLDINKINLCNNNCKDRKLKIKQIKIARTKQNLIDNKKKLKGNNNKKKLGNKEKKLKDNNKKK